MPHLCVKWLARARASVQFAEVRAKEKKGRRAQDLGVRSRGKHRKGDEDNARPIRLLLVWAHQ